MHIFYSLLSGNCIHSQTKTEALFVVQSKAVIFLKTDDICIRVHSWILAFYLSCFFYVKIRLQKFIFPREKQRYNKNCVTFLRLKTN